MPRRGRRRLLRRRRHTAGTGRRSAFTLVELLVVIGIIALLIAILLPALNRAREQANFVKCQATLRSMGQACELHALDHQGYFPLAGTVAVPLTPADLGDALRRHYVYYVDGIGAGPEGLRETMIPAPLSASLGIYMNASVDLGSRKGMEGTLRQPSLTRLFACPSDESPITPASTLTWISGARLPDEVTSYLLNGAALGVCFTDGSSPAGKVSQIRHPAEVLLFGDGKRGTRPEVAYTALTSGDATLDGTLYDFWFREGQPKEVGGDGYYASFDYRRHRGRMNALFVDGHVETLVLPRLTVARSSPDEPSFADFKRVGVSKGIYH